MLSPSPPPPEPVSLSAARARIFLYLVFLYPEADLPNPPGHSLLTPKVNLIWERNATDLVPVLSWSVSPRGPDCFREPWALVRLRGEPSHTHS